MIARTAADLTGLNRRTVTLYYHKIRQVIADNLALHAEEVFGGEVELDGSYFFGGVRKSKRGRGAAGKLVIFGILKRGGKVYTQVIQDTKTDTFNTPENSTRQCGVYRFIAQLQCAGTMHWM